MKIWKGTEKELDMKYRTLFIQTSNLTMKQFEKILEISKKTNIKRLYFGAGKIEFEDFEKLKLLPHSNVEHNDFSILIETAYPEEVPKEYQIVYRVELPKYEELRKSTIIKVETRKKVSTVKLSEMFTVGLDTLNQKTLMYNTDELLWED